MRRSVALVALLVACAACRPAAGAIALQIHGNAVPEVRFRDIEIEELPATLPSGSVSDVTPRTAPR